MFKIISISITYSTDRYKCRKDDTRKIYLSCSHLSLTLKRTDRWDLRRHKWNTVCKASKLKHGGNAKYGKLWDEKILCSTLTKPTLAAYLALSWWIWQWELPGIYMRRRTLWIRLVAVVGWLDSQMHINRCRMHLAKPMIHIGFIGFEDAFNFCERLEWDK